MAKARLNVSISRSRLNTRTFKWFCFFLSLFPKCDFTTDFLTFLFVSFSICLFSSPIYLLCAPANFKRSSAAESDWAIVSGRTQCGTNNSSFVSILCLYFRCLFLLYGFIARTKEKSDNEIFSQVFFVARDLRKNTTRLDEICDETERKWSSSIKLSRGFHSSPDERNENRWHLFIFFRWVNLSQIRSNFRSLRGKTRVSWALRESEERKFYTPFHELRPFDELWKVPRLFSSRVTRKNNNDGTNAM